MSSLLIPPREERRHLNSAGDNRSNHQRDRDRILYNSAFRRLAGVTQVIGAEEGDVFHNRLTHSIKVAQFGRRLAEKLVNEHAKDADALGGISPDVVEAAGLAHDIGHPPYGHLAEVELDKLAMSAGGFEGNAQSFRIITKLAIHARWSAPKLGLTPNSNNDGKPEYEGLDLTRATLNAVLKYPWLRNDTAVKKSMRKWGSYDSERTDLEFVRQLTHSGDKRRSVEAELMDWADDVTYSVHDMEDFYKAGLIPLDRLRRDEQELRRFFDGAFSRPDSEAATSGYERDKLESAFEYIIKVIPVEEPYQGTQRQRCSLRNLTTSLIGDYIRAVESLCKSGPQRLLIRDEHRMRVIMGKELTWYYVINRPELAMQQHGQRKIIAGLFQLFIDAADRKDFCVFPPGARERMEYFRDAGSGVGPELVRAVVDLIAGMTEQQIVRIYHRLTGVSLGSVFQPLLY